jgi:hypothetical protein
VPNGRQIWELGTLISTNFKNLYVVHSVAWAWFGLVFRNFLIHEQLAAGKTFFFFNVSHQRCYLITYIEVFISRILANRQSAQRSRVRKLQYISELEKSVTALQVLKPPCNLKGAQIWTLQNIQKDLIYSNK